MQNLSIIVAMDKNQLIGINNQIPWHISSDLKRFKSLTTGHTIVMGRKTFESFGKPLPNRNHIVITTQMDYSFPGITVVHSIEEAMEHISAINEEVFIIGGGDIYRQFMPLCNKLYLTLVNTELSGDTFFPTIDFLDWELVYKECHPVDEQTPLGYTYKNFVRKNRT